MGRDNGRERPERLEAGEPPEPSWEPVGDGEDGHFTSTADRLRGRLRNSGLTTAAVRAAYLDVDGQRAPVDTRCDRPHGGGGWTKTTYVPPQSVVELEARLQRINFHGDARPRLHLDFKQIDTGVESLRVELSRSGRTRSGETVWRVRRLRAGAE